MEILLGDSSNYLLIIQQEPLLCELIYDEFTKVFPKNPINVKMLGRRGPSQQSRLTPLPRQFYRFQDDFQMIAAYNVSLDNLLADDGFHTMNDEAL